MGSFAVLSACLGFLMFFCLDWLLLIPEEMTAVEIIVLLSLMLIACIANGKNVAFFMVRTHCVARWAKTNPSNDLIVCLRLDLLMYLMWAAQYLLSTKEYAPVYEKIQSYLQNREYIFWIGSVRRVAMIMLVLEAYYQLTTYGIYGVVFFTPISDCTFIISIFFCTIWVVQHNVDIVIIRGLIRMVQIVLVRDWIIQFLLIAFQGVVIMLWKPNAHIAQKIEQILVFNPLNMVILSMMIAEGHVNLTILFMTMTWGSVVDPVDVQFTPFSFIASALKKLFEKCSNIVGGFAFNCHEAIAYAFGLSPPQIVEPPADQPAASAPEADAVQWPYGFDQSAASAPPLSVQATPLANGKKTRGARRVGGVDVYPAGAWPQDAH